VHAVTTPRRSPIRIVLPVLFATALAPAEDWPRFQGPRGDGTSAETGLARSWPPEGPPVAWSAPVGPGFGGAAVRDGEVLILDRGEDREALRCLDFATGAERWRVEYDAPGRLPYDGSRSVPTVTDAHVLTAGSFGHVMCVDRTTRQPVWQCSLEERFGGEMPAFGWAQSPLLHGPLVIVAPLGERVGLAALRADTGAEAWRSEPIGTSHSNPTLMTLNGQTQLLMVSSVDERGLLTSLDPDTGRVLWQHEGFFAKRSIPGPTRVDDGRVLLTAGYRAGSMLLAVRRPTAGFETTELFRHPRGSQIHLPIVTGGHVYLLANENWNDRRRHEQGGLMCMDLQGNERWRTGADPYLGRGPMLLADGMLIVQDGYSGVLRLVEPRADAFRVLARADLFGVTDDDDHRMWAPMALSAGRLLVRSQDELKCVDVRSRPPMER
jgi:outer membrane protein assembly factor BamB